MERKPASALTGFHAGPRGHIGLWKCLFMRRKARKTREPGKKASEQGEKQQTQPTYGWRRALSPLRQCTLLHLNKENKEHTTAITTLTSSDIPMMPC